MDGMSAMEQIEATRKEIIPLIAEHAECWKNELVPALAKEDIYIEQFSELPEKRKETLREFFKKSILPELKIPKEGFNGAAIENLHVTLFVSGYPKEDICYLLDVPTEKFGRLIRIPRSNYSPDIDSIEYNFVFLEDLMMNNLDLIFPNEKTLTAYPFRLTRNGEINILMDESSDFLNSVKKSLPSRRAGFPSRLEFDKRMPPFIREAIATALNVPNNTTYEFDAPLGFVDLWHCLKSTAPTSKTERFCPQSSRCLPRKKTYSQPSPNRTSYSTIPMMGLK
jgi:polyphosphate kinase